MKRMLGLRGYQGVGLEFVLVSPAGVWALRLGFRRLRDGDWWFGWN